MAAGGRTANIPFALFAANAGKAGPFPCAGVVCLTKWAGASKAGYFCVCFPGTISKAKHRGVAFALGACLIPETDNELKYGRGRELIQN
jgi:hypothetical protein